MSWQYGSELTYYYTPFDIEVFGESMSYFEGLKAGKGDQGVKAKGREAGHLSGLFSLLTFKIRISLLASSYVLNLALKHFVKYS